MKRKKTMTWGKMVHAQVEMREVIKMASID